MARTSANKVDEKRISKNTEKLLDEQTSIILGAVDGKFREANKRFEKIKKAISDLAISLDKFLKRLTDFSDEFEIVKARVQKIEKILRDKLGVTV